MKIDAYSVPFSRFLSYLSFNWLDAQWAKNSGVQPGLWLRKLHGDGQPEVFRLETVQTGNPVPFELEASAEELQLRTEHGRVRLCLADADQVRIRAEGVGLRLSMPDGMFNCAVDVGGGRWRLNAFSAWREYTAVPLTGTLEVDAPWDVAKCTHVIADILPGDDGIGECALHQSRGTAPLPDAYPGFDDTCQAVKAEFDRFFATYPPCRGDLQETARLAAYVNWASTVGPCDKLARPTMFMSKNWMTSVWSWDHCFNAMGLAAGNPELAWDQFMVVFDHQTPQGQIPDILNATSKLYNFVKPPIHGWAYRTMMHANPDFFAKPERLAEVYNKLSAWSRWWLNFRAPDGDGLPTYHHGNDSGWDNGTVFDVGLPVKAPDAAAFLSLQMDVLADLAERLGRADDAGEWRRRAEFTLKNLLETLWVNDRFVTRHAIAGSVNEQARSVIPCTPIVLGKRLPATVRGELVKRIEENLTEWGPATESPDSPLYESNGYWRGPIWAPPTMILVDGLRAAGETQLANTIAERFCTLCATSGFAENFDAVTGNPLCDKAYTWTASTFLLLANSLAAPRYNYSLGSAPGS
ncbi:MAG: amylo-alpha-1,6-glucosidase [Verrucomicrobiota bacterium]